MHHTGQQIIAHTVIFYTFIRTNGRKVETWSCFFSTSIQHQTEPSYSMWLCLGIHIIIIHCTIQYSTSIGANLSVTVTPHAASVSLSSSGLQHSSACKLNCSRKEYRVIVCTQQGYITSGLRLCVAVL